VSAIYTDGEEAAGSAKAEPFLVYLKRYDSHGLLDPSDRRITIPQNDDDCLQISMT
jgi:hypothetical protein